MKKKVLIIGLDGCRADAFQKATTPNLDQLAKNGVYSWNAQTELHTISGPAWTSLLTGVHDDKHKVFDNDFKPRNLAYKTLFSLVKEKYPQIRCVGHSHWKPIITEIFEKKILNHSSSGSDRKMAYRIAQDIKKDKGDLYFVQLDEIDGAGHQYTYHVDSPNYIKKIEEIDQYVGEMIAAVKTRPIDEDWLISVVSDHGGEGKSHGAPTSGCLTIIFIISGNPVPTKGEIPGVEEKAPSIVDVVPTIAKFLEFTPKPEWDGIIRGL